MCLVTHRYHKASFRWTKCCGPWVLGTVQGRPRTPTAYPWILEPRPRACEHSTTPCFGDTLFFTNDLFKMGQTCFYDLIKGTCRCVLETHVCTSCPLLGIPARTYMTEAMLSPQGALASGAPALDKLMHFVKQASEQASKRAN